MLITQNPDAAPKPAALYSQSVEVPANARWLVLAGQVGMTPDGTILETIEEQDEQIWKNTVAILDASGFGVEDVVKLTVFSTDPAALSIHMKHRERYLSPNHTPASTWLNVSSLARPQFLIEMEAVAAKAG